MEKKSNAVRRAETELRALQERRCQRCSKARFIEVKSGFHQFLRSWGTRVIKVIYEGLVLLPVSYPRSTEYQTDQVFRHTFFTGAARISSVLDTFKKTFEAELRLL